MHRTTLRALTFFMAIAGMSSTSWAQTTGPDQIARGRYLVKIQGCNDCHTPGYNEANGQTPENQWLTGSNVGYRGPWGTSYPKNVRSIVWNQTEEEWVQYAKTVRAFPPMPWFNLNAVNDEDLRAMYAFIKSLGDSPNQVPAVVPPGQEPTTSYINFVPVNPSAPR